MITLHLLRALRPARGPLPSVRTLSTCYRYCAAQNFLDYESLKQLYKPQVPEYFNFAHDVLGKWAQLEKDRRKPVNPALWWVDGRGCEVRWSFEELEVLSKKVANILTDTCGMKAGDRVIVILPRIPEWWLFNVACMRAGIVLIPGTTQLTAKDVLHRLKTSKASCVVVSDTLAPAIDSIVSQCPSVKSKLLVSDGSRDGWLSFKDLFKIAPEDQTCVKTKSTDPLTIFFTSGTTGAPKMVQHTHCSLGIGLGFNGKYWMDLTPSDILWNVSDTGWAKSAWSNIFAPWSQGSCVFIHSMPRFDTPTILDTLSSYPITTFCSAPTAYRMMVQHNIASYRFKSLRHCVTAGEPMYREVIKEWKSKTGLDIYEGYGQSETTLVCANFKGMKIKPGSMGKVNPVYDVQIIDENGNILPPGNEGDFGIRVKPTRPFCLFSGYADDPEKTASMIRGNFYLTGDRGIMDEDGYFWFVARSDDVILTSGYRIGPYEVENALIEHPAVVESAVVSSPDPIRGEIVKAFVVLAPAYASHDPEVLKKELQEHVKTVTAPYKYPRKVEFVQELPKTVSGKIRRKELRNKEWGKVENKRV